MHCPQHWHGHKIALLLLRSIGGGLRCWRGHSRVEAQQVCQPWLSVMPSCLGARSSQGGSARQAGLGRPRTLCTMCRCEWWGALQCVGWLVWLAHLLLPAKVECSCCLPDVMLCVYGHVVKCHQEVTSGQMASKWRPGRGVQYNGAATPGVARQQAPMEPPQHGSNGQAQHLEWRTTTVSQSGSV